MPAAAHYFGSLADNNCNDYDNSLEEDSMDIYSAPLSTRQLRAHGAAEAAAMSSPVASPPFLASYI